MTKLPIFGCYAVDLWQSVVHVAYVNASGQLQEDRYDMPLGGLPIGAREEHAQKWLSGFLKTHPHLYNHPDLFQILHRLNSSICCRILELEHMNVNCATAVETCIVPVYVAPLLMELEAMHMHIHSCLAEEHAYARLIPEHARRSAMLALDLTYNKFHKRIDRCHHRFDEQSSPHQQYTLIAG